MEKKKSKHYHTMKVMNYCIDRKAVIDVLENPPKTFKEKQDLLHFKPNIGNIRNKNCEHTIQTYV